MLARMMTPDRRARFRGCLLGGAVGDALGAPVEFLRAEQIARAFGPGGIRDFALAYGRKGAITDDTQMTLFTAEALLRMRVAGKLDVSVDPASVACGAYLRWLWTQAECPGVDLPPDPGLLLPIAALHERRGPGSTCLESLQGRTDATGTLVVNDRKGCGGVMRMAPVGLDCVSGQTADLPRALTFGRTFAALTHGHPTGSIAAGAFAAIVALVASGLSIGEAVDQVLAEPLLQRDACEVFEAVTTARRLAQERGTLPAAAIALLGEGWIAEEALAIASYCALIAPTFEEGVVMAVNHGGDSDSTGAIAGNLLGAIHGVDAIPKRWCRDVELGDLVLQIADDLCDAPDWTVTTALSRTERYPPH
jgi:ADP-ribosylglycohydrolase